MKEMVNKQENAKEMLRQVLDLFEGRKEYSHMTGDIELCGKTADDAIREIKDREK